jgi:putative PIN family toxin of toxin-antitoxin system
VRIVLDTTILVRATEKSHGPARDLLLNIVASENTLVLSNQILHELARVLRYPRLRDFYGLSEARVYDFIAFLREVAEIVTLSPLLIMPSRDVNDMVVVQTAVVGEVDILCTRDEDFYSPPASELLDKAGIAIMDDISLLHRLRRG